MSLLWTAIWTTLAVVRPYITGAGDLAFHNRLAAIIFDSTADYLRWASRQAPTVGHEEKVADLLKNIVVMTMESVPWQVRGQDPDPNARFSGRHDP